MKKERDDPTSTLNGVLFYKLIEIRCLTISQPANFKAYARM